MEDNKVWAHPVSLATTPGLVIYFLLLWVLRCFSSPAYRLSILFNSDGGHTTFLVRGFPIRTSTVQSLLDSSPRLIAIYYVLLRCLTSRHPLCALE